MKHSTILPCAPTIMTDGTRGQGANRLEDSVHQLRDSSDKHAIAIYKQAAEITDLTKLVTAMNLKYD
ncbi:unnamed protein product [Ilex paraguariensis]|uniref:BLOC-1-related complex subunit 7 n=1 Tax=Ilex paraguariensis TaxID=185542 RepID=A0ABC8SGL7_9AQUA